MRARQVEAQQHHLVVRRELRLGRSKAANMTIKTFLIPSGSTQTGWSQSTFKTVLPVLPVSPNLEFKLLAQPESCEYNNNKKTTSNWALVLRSDTTIGLPWFSNRNQADSVAEVFAMSRQVSPPPGRKCEEGRAVQLCSVANAEASRLTAAENTSIRGDTGLLDRHLRLSVQHGERWRYIRPASRYGDPAFVQFNGGISQVWVKVRRFSAYCFDRRGAVALGPSC